MSIVPKFEQLEDRIVLDGVPDVTIDAPDTIEIGEQDVAVTLTFDNIGTDPGYVPYIDFVIPTTGEDGDDGVTFDSASFLGAAITTTEIVFDASGLAVHPLATDVAGDPLIISAADFGAQPGDTLIVFELPYGSFSPGNPPVDIDVILDFSPLADLSEDFDLTAVGGFALGCDPLDNPGTDAPIRSAVTAPTTVSQTLFEVFKASTIPEGEAANGPSYPYQYTFGVDVADGQALDNFSLIDSLPHNIVYLGGLTITGGSGATIISEPAVGAAITGANDELQIDFTEVTDTVTVTFDFYVSETLSDDAAPVITPGTGTPGSVTNTVTGSGDWEPLDPRDSPTVVSDSAFTTSEVAALNIQKGISLFADNNPSVAGTSPGDEFLFTLNIQVSNYLNMGDLVVEDLLGNGWEFVTGSATFTSVEEVGSITTAQNFAGNLDVDLTDFGVGGTTGLTFDLSQAMIDAGQDGLLTGDAARPGAISETPTTVTITYRALIRDEFTDAGGLGQLNVGQGDVLTNDVDVMGQVYDNDTGLATGNTIADESQATVTLDVGGIREKTVTAVNGVAFDPLVPIAAGDEVTFSLIYDSPLGSFDGLVLTDNLPQNVFDALEVTTFYEPGAGPALPPPGQATYGPQDTFFSNLAAPATPGLSTNGPDNQIDFDLSNLNVDPRQPVVVEILVTVTVQDALFSPDLLLTNQVTAFENNVAQGTTDTTAIAQFIYAEPELNITKGVVAFTPNPNSDVTLGATGPTPFNAPGTVGPRFAGTINSTNLDVTPIDADISGIDAGDIVTFAIAVENTGRAPNGAFDVVIEDTLPAGFVLSGATGNVFVSDGNGNPIAFTGDLFAGGITLTDPPPVGGLAEGAISAFDATAGDNVVIVTYDLVVDPSVVPGQELENTAGLTSFAALEGGVDRVPDDDLTDTAEASVDEAEIDKSLNLRQFSDDGSITGRGGNEVVVGEMVEFTIRVDIPEATYFDAEIRDRVTAGALVLESAVIDASPIAGQVGVAATLVGGEIVFDLGDFVNPGDNDLTNDFIEITVTARVDDLAGFNANGLLRNVASFGYADTDGGPTSTIQDANDLRLTEPNLTIDKEADDDVVEAGQIVNYSIDIDNIAGFRDAPAFDLTLSDALPSPEMALDVGSIQLFIGGALVAFDGTNFDLTTSGNGFDVFIDRLDPGQSAEIRYSAQVLQTITAGREIENTASLVFDSTPEDDSAADGDDREYSLSDTETILARAPGIDKVVDTASTTYPETTGTDLGIGELVTYEITVVIPEGETDNVILTDTLPAGLEYVTSEIVRIGAAGDRITGPDIGPGLVEAGDEGVNAGLTTTFDFGDLSNAFDGAIDVDDEIVVRITARLTAAAGVDTSDVLTNSSALTFDDGQGNTQSVVDTADIDVVEPFMELVKDITPTTADAGETVSYTLTATNSGDGPAYDMIIADDIVGAAVTADQGSVVITLRDDVGGIYTPVEAPSFSFNGAGELQVIIPTLPAGYEAEITYDAVVEDAALFSTAYVNTAEITRYDSNPDGDTATPPAGADDEERVYDAGLAGYVVPEATATFTTPDVTLEKTYLSSSDSNTADAGAGNAELVVGETVTYLLTITVPEGQANLVLTDVLPTGLEAQSATVISMDGSTSTTLAAGATDTSDTDITLTLGSVSFDFGTLSLPGTADAAASDTEITVSVTALVTDTLPQVADGNSLTNTATLEVTDPLGGGDLQPDVVATETVDIVEPELVIEKTGPVGGDPSEAIPYQITVTNSGTGPAYDAIISDPIANAFLSLVGGSISVTHSAGTIIPPGDITENAFAGDGFTIENLTLLPGETVTVDFSILIDAGAPDANSFTNTATVNYDTVDDGDPDSPTGRDGTDSDDHTIATVPRIVKTPFSSSYAETNSDAPTDVPFDLAIGEEVTYRYVITLPEIEMESVFVQDTLPPGFDYVSFSIGATGDITGANLLTPTVDNSGASNIVSFDFGALNNNNTVDGINANDDIVLLVTAVVTDDGANTAGADRTNAVTLDVDPAGPTGPFNQQTSEADVRIVEPELEIDKTGPAALSPGASGTYTIVVENTGPSVVPSATGPAFDVEISDVLDPELTLDAGPITVLLNGAAVTPDSIVRGPGGFTLGFDVLDADDVLTISYSATLDAGATALDTFVNTATANYDSTPGTPADPDEERTYAPVSDDHVVGTLPELTKTPISSNVAETGDAQNVAGVFDLAIGEEVTYELVLTLPDIAMDVVELVDTLPPGMEFVSARLVSTSADVVINGTTTITSAATGATFTITDVVNDISGADLNQITLEIVSRVRDDVANVDTVQLTNSAGLTISPEGEGPLTTVTDTAVVEIVEPALTLEKTGNVAVNPGETVDYTLVIENTGTGPAFDVIVADTLSNPFLSLVSGSVTIDLGGDITATVDVTETATGFTFELDDNGSGLPIPILPGETLTVSYSALLDAAAPDAQSFLNEATADYDSLPGDPVDGDGNPIDDRDYTITDDFSVATVPFLVKTPTATDFAETSDTPFELAIGETITYTYQLYVPEIEMSEISFFDDLPVGMEYVSHTVVSNGDMTAIGGGAFPSPVVTVVGNDLTLTFLDVDNPEDTAPPTIGTDDIITITVDAIVTSASSAGDMLTNEAILQITPNGGGTLNQSTATATVGVVEPELSVDKTGPLGANPGDTVPFEIVVENVHTSGSTGPAYDVTLSDVLPPEFSLNTGSITFVSDQRGALAPATLTATATGFDATFSELLADEVLTINYTADLSATPPLSASFVNEVTVAYDSAPGANPEQEVYDPVTDDHRIGTIPQLSKTIIDTDIPQTGTDQHVPGNEDVSIGELITYELVVTLPEFDGQTVSLVDDLPPGLEFISSEVTAVGAEITGVTAGDTGLATAAGQVITFNFGTLNNAYATGAADEGVIDAEDQIIIEVVVRVADVPAATDGAVLTNNARLNVTQSDGFIFAEQQAEDSVDVVEPQIDIDKTVSDAEPMVGDTITYTVVLTNDPAATGPAFNLIISDMLPDDLSLAGTPVLSDPALGTTISAAGDRTLVVSVPVLLPGETLTLTYDVFVGFASPVLMEVVNTAEVTGSTTPNSTLPDGGGRPFADADTAIIEIDPAPEAPVERNERLPGGGIDDAQFLPVLLIDPIFSGTAEPGSNVTVTLYRQDGSLNYVRNIMADAGGHWIAIFPSVTLETVQDESNEFFNRTVLFDAPYDPLDDIQRDSIGTPIVQRSVTTGAILADEGYSLTLQQDRPSTLPQDAGLYNARTYFNPAVAGEGYGSGIVLKIDEVFENVAGLTVERLYDATTDPLGVSLNRFNYEFLSDATAMPGGAR
jgi:fimbrial isopeptide formation D2 family protein/uncharacterized repeat protein (TIGR01451 family)